MPSRLFPRLMLLLLGVLAVNAIVMLALLRFAAFDATTAYTARSLETQVVAADSLLASPDRAAAEARFAQLGLRLAANPPPSTRPLAPLWHDVSAALAERLPARKAHIVTRPDPMLWVAAEHRGDGWIGVPLLGLRGSLRATTALGFVLAVLIVTGAAALATRTLVRPLRTLAAAAPRIAAGEPAPPLPPRAAAEIRDLAEALERAAGDVRIANREREIMLAGISHDMRTPLARLALALEMVDGDAELRRGMATDIAEIDAIVGQFIGFVRDGRGENATVTDLGALLDDAIAAQQRAGRTWQRKGAARLNLRVKPLALRRTLDNLLENAACHGHDPLEVELRADGAGAVVFVRDRGPGVADDRLHDLGRPFYRVDAARSTSGSGLGLAIAARTAAAHGGALALRNRAGGGFEAELRLRGAANGER